MNAIHWLRFRTVRDLRCGRAGIRHRVAFGPGGNAHPRGDCRCGLLCEGEVSRRAFGFRESHPWRGVWALAGTRMPPPTMGRRGRGAGGRCV
jgi:hypothetical protein